MISKKIFAAIILLSGMLFHSCSEDEITTYRGDNYIYFGPRYVKNSEIWDNLQTFNFSHARPGLTDTTINVRVNIGGPVTNYDRTFYVKYSSTGKAGVDHVVVAREQKIPAGRNFGYVPVKLIRTSEMDEAVLNLYLELEPSPDFPTIMPFYRISNNVAPVNREHFAIDYTATLTAPPLYETYIISAIGYWSPAKFDKMNEVWGTTMEDWLDEESRLTNNIKIYLTVFANYLNAKISEGPEAAIKDSHEDATRGYMTLKGSGPLEIPEVKIPGWFPNAE